VRTIRLKTRLVKTGLAVVLLLGVLPAAGLQAGAQEASDDLLGDVLIPTRDAAGQPLDGVDVAVGLSQVIFESAGSDGAPRRVVLASSSSFADALAAAVVLDDAPLLLTTPDALPAAVRNELSRLQPLEVVILGGPAAVSPDVEAEVAALGLRTVRIAGATRVETAVEVARAFASTAETAIVVRATDASGGNGSAAWADSVTAGALAAEEGWPILLTASDALSEPTRVYLAQSAVDSVLIIGGTAAVSQGVQQQLLSEGYFVDRIAGANRAETAVMVAEARGVQPGGRAVIVEGEGDLGWQTGLIAAGHAADTGAAVLPIPDGTFPAEIAGYLAATAPNAFTCLVAASVCQQAGGRVGGTGGTVEGISYNPEPGSALAPFEAIVVGLDDPDRRYTGDISLASLTAGCVLVSPPPAYLPEAAATFAIDVPPNPQEGPGDQPPTPGPVSVQPTPGTGDASGSTTEPGTSATASPVDPNEESPGEPHPTRCLVAVTVELADGSTATDEVGFDVVDLHPHIRVTSFPQVEDRPVTFADRSHGVIASWDWSFGDGSGSAEQHPTHTYQDRGCYDVELALTSPYRHWYTGQPFRDGASRTLAIDPATDDTHLEVLFIDRAADDAPVVGAVVEATRAGVTVTATTGSDGRAVFGDLGPGTWTITSDDAAGGGFDQDVVPGHTLCPVLARGPLGDLLVTVLDAGGAPIAGATVTIASGDEVKALGSTGADGRYLAVELLAESYQVTAVRSSGTTIGSTTAAVVEGEVTPVEIREPAPAEPPPAGTT
jgi:putative cell wall-binding protein